MRRNSSFCLCYFKLFQVTLKREWHIPGSSSGAKLAALTSRSLVSRRQPISVLPCREETAQSNSDFQNIWVTMTFGRNYCCCIAFWVFFTLKSTTEEKSLCCFVYEAEISSQPKAKQPESITSLLKSHSKGLKSNCQDSKFHSVTFNRCAVTLQRHKKLPERGV